MGMLTRSMLVLTHVQTLLTFLFDTRLSVAMEDTVHMVTSRTTTTSTNTSSTGMDTTVLTRQHTTPTRTSHTEENEEVSTPLVFLLEAQALTLALAQALPTLVLPIPDLPALPQCLLLLHLAPPAHGQADSLPTTDQRRPTLTALLSRRSSALLSAQMERFLHLVTTLLSATSTPTAHRNGSRDLLTALNLLILWLFWLNLQHPLPHPGLKPGHQ